MKPSIEEIITVYSDAARVKFHEIRSLIFAVAKQNGIGEIEETLKWGQPSYLCTSGSTIRVDWQQQRPHSISVFFNCNTTLVETFKEIFKGSLNFEGNRIVLISLDSPTPKEFEVCLLMALNYHKLKRLPLLGA